MTHPLAGASVSQQAKVKVRGQEVERPNQSQQEKWKRSQQRQKMRIHSPPVASKLTSNPKLTRTLGSSALAHEITRMQSTTALAHSQTLTGPDHWLDTGQWGSLWWEWGSAPTKGKLHPAGLGLPVGQVAPGQRIA